MTTTLSRSASLLFVLLLACVVTADVPPSNATPWIDMDRGPYFSASVESSLPERAMTPKGILIRVNPTQPAYVLFDADLLRYSVGWTGGLLDFHNVLFDGSHQTWNKVVGHEVFGTSMAPGWAKNGSFEDPRERFASVDYLPQPPSWQKRGYGPLPRDWGRYKGLYVHGDRVILSYSVGGIPVLESPGWESIGSSGAFSRTINLDHCSELVLQVAEHPLQGGGIWDGHRRLPTAGPAEGTVAILGEIPAANSALPSAGKPQIPSDGLVSSWTLNPDDAAGGASEKRYAAEFHGGTFAPPQTHDPYGSLVLKRGEFAIVNDANGIDLSSDFSLSAWVRTTEGGTILSKTAAGKWVAGGKALFVRNGALTFDIGWVGSVASSHPVNDDRWHHVTLTYHRSDGMAQLYIDGEPDDLSKLRSVPDPSKSQIRFALTSDNFPAVAANRFVGRIGPVHLYRRTLAPQEVAGMADPVGKRAMPLAVAAIGADGRLSWELTAQSQLRLHFRASNTPVKVKLLLAPLENPADLATFISAAKSSPAPADLSTLTHGGPSRWSERLTTQGTVNPAPKPYVIDTLTLPVDNPWRSRMRLGGFDFFKDGHRAAVCTWDGDVWLVAGIDERLDHLTWRRIAAGMFQPLGLKIVPDEHGAEQIFVCCRDQITRLHDLNGDGEIDFYESFNNDHQVTEHFHEFAMDLQTDAEGNFYYGKGGRHALPAVVPQHGTILKVSKDGSTTQIIANGLRAPNGFGLGPNGEMVTSDQEGHWTPANRIDLLKPGGFYGYMWSYAGATRKTSEGYDPPLCWLPVNLDRSPAEELWVTSDRWGPLKGKMIHTSYGTGQMFLVMYEYVDGVPQGGVVPFPDVSFNTGSMRARFNPVDGQLYVCGLVGWASNLSIPGGFYRVRYTGRRVYLPTDLHVTTDTVTLTFSEPLDKTSAEDSQNYAVQQWQYRWTAKYGSAHYRISNPGLEGQDDVPIAGASLSADRKRVSLHIPGLKPVMQMQIELNVDAADGTAIHTVIHNTINTPPR